MTMRTLIVPALALTLAVAAGCSKSDAQDGKQSGEAQTAQSSGDEAAAKLGLLPAGEAPVAPDWTLETADGGQASLSDYKGKVVVLDFWDTWCPPCKAEIPGFVELQETYGDDGLVIIGAAFANEGKEAVEAFIKEYEINYPVVYVTAQVNQAYGGIQSIPTTFVIDREGRARAMHVGFVEKNVFEREIKALL